MTRMVNVLGVRRYGEDDTTPIVLDDRRVCGLGSDHRRNGCIGVSIEVMGGTGLIHLTSDEALRLSDLLRAMAETNTAP